MPRTILRREHYVQVPRLPRRRRNTEGPAVAEKYPQVIPWRLVRKVKFQGSDQVFYAMSKGLYERYGIVMGWPRWTPENDVSLLIQSLPDSVGTQMPLLFAGDDGNQGVMDGTAVDVKCESGDVKSLVFTNCFRDAEMAALDPQNRFHLITMYLSSQTFALFPSPESST